MRKIACGLVLMVAAATLPNTATAAGGAPTPERFIRSLYADLARPEISPRGPLWWSYLSQRTHTLLRQLQAADARRGDGSIDYDWLCQCNDGVGLRIRSLIVTSSSPSTARATVQFGSERVILELVQDHGWKIADIIDRRNQRFTSWLMQETRGR